MHPWRIAALLTLPCVWGGAGCCSRCLPVTQYGALHDVFREQQSAARISLAEATRLGHAYAVGALENLAGEITIVDGDVWVARAAGGELSVTGPKLAPSDQATLLTHTRVWRWKRIRLTEPLSGEGLEGAIESHAVARGLEPNEPFVFMIRGTITQLDAHIIAGSCPFDDAPDTTPPWRLSLDEPIDAVLIGFFARDQAGVMTHHDTRVHMHVVMPWEGHTITAHVDQVALAAGTELRLPM